MTAALLAVAGTPPVVDLLRRRATASTIRATTTSGAARRRPRARSPPKASVVRVLARRGQHPRRRGPRRPRRADARPRAGGGRRARAWVRGGGRLARARRSRARRRRVATLLGALRHRARPATSSSTSGRACSAPTGCPRRVALPEPGAVPVARRQSQALLPEAQIAPPARRRQASRARLPRHDRRDRRGPTSTAARWRTRPAVFRPGARPARPAAPGRVRRDARRRRATRAHLVVVGDADFASNLHLNMLGNRDLLLATAELVARDDALTAPAPAAGPAAPSRRSR